MRGKTGGIYRTTYGPAWFESLLAWPKSSLVVIDANLGNDTISIARDQFAAHIKAIGWDRIRALEREYSILEPRFPKIRFSLGIRASLITGFVY